jgi:pimeloyl-ACP methyl ester carboxylesterase
MVRNIPRGVAVILTPFLVFALSVTTGAQGGSAAPKPLDTRTVSVKGADIYVESFGSGEPLLLLHGFGGCGGMWTPFVRRLSEHFRVIVPDLRGHGRSTNPSGLFTHRQAAEDIAALLDTLKLPRIKAMGISTGGMTLLHLATAQPERVDAMVLVGATHYFPEQARAIMRKEAAGPPPPDVLSYYRECASRGESQVTHLMETFGAFKDSYDDMNFTKPYLGTIRARTLIVHGDRDEFFPVDIPVEMYQAIPQAQLWIVPDGDHVPIFGARARMFTELTLGFLQRSSTAAGKQ